MFCHKCGTQLTDDSRFCYKCGTPTVVDEQADRIDATDSDSFDAPASPAIDDSAPQQPQAKSQNPASSEVDDGIYAIIGFVLAFFVPIVGLVFSIIGMRKKKYNSLATAGFVLSILFAIIYTTILLITIDSPSSYPYYYHYH